MSCNYRLADLTQLVGGDAEPRARKRLEAHLPACAKCRDDLRFVTELWSAAAKGCSEAPPEALRARIASAVNATRRRPVRLWPALSGAAAVSVALAAGVVALNARSMPALGDVVRAMQTVRTASWTEVSHQPQRNNGMLVTTARVWARVTPPAICTQYAADTEMLNGAPAHNDETIQLADQRGSLTWYPARNLWFLESGWNTPKSAQAATVGEVLRRIQGPTPVPSDQAGWAEDRASLDGRTLLRFRRSAGNRFWRWNEVVWVDPSSVRIVRRERVQSDRSEGAWVRRSWTCSDYRYDTTPPAGTFDLTPPRHAVRLPQSSDLTDRRFGIWASVSKATRRSIQHTLEHAVQAWGAGDSATFERQWDFDRGAGLPDESYPAYGPRNAAARRTYWLTRLSKMKAHPCDATGTLMNLVWVRDLPSDRLHVLGLSGLPSAARDILLAPVVVSVPLGRGTSTGMLGYFYLAREGAAFKVVRWDFAW